MPTTRDQLRAKRYITTQYVVNDKTALVVETSHARYRKAIETEVYATEIEGPFVVRHYTPGAQSIGNGVTLLREPVARWNAKRAAEMHDFVVTSLRLLLEQRDASHVPAQLLRLLDEHDLREGAA